MGVTSGRRRLGLALIGGLALAVGPFATYQLTRTAERSPALLLADLAVGWSMIAAGLLIADRRPGNRIGVLAILTGFAWFAGDFTNSDVAGISYAATLAHGWFDPLFAIVILAYPSGRIIGRAERLLAIGFIGVQAGWTIAKAYGSRPIGWWECPTCIPTVDAWIAAYDALDPIGRAETLVLTGLSVGVLVVVAVRWLRATGAARMRLSPIVLAGLVLAAGFIVSFLLQTVAPTSAREPLGELRVILLAVLRVLVAAGLLIGVLRTDAARGRIADLVVRLDGLPPMPVLEASLRDALGDPSLSVYRWEPASARYMDARGVPSVEPASDGSGRTILTIGDGVSTGLVIAHDPSLRDDPGLVTAATAAVRLAAENERLQAEIRSQLDWCRRREHGSSKRRTTSVVASNATSTMAPSSASSRSSCRSKCCAASSARMLTLGPSRNSTRRPPKLRRPSTTSASWPVASTRRSSPKQGSARRWPPSAIAPRCLSSCTTNSTDACLRLSRRRRTSWWRRHSPT